MVSHALQHLIQNRRPETHTHTREPLNAVAATFPDVAVTTLPNSADANSVIGGLTLNPEVTGTSEMPTTSKQNVNVSGSTSGLAKCDWLSVGACVLNSACNGPSLVSCLS